MSLPDSNLCHSTSAISSCVPYFSGFFTANTPSPAPSPSPSSCSSSPAMSSNRQPNTILSQQAQEYNDCSCRGEYYDELWQACAGPIVSLPRVKQLVMYMPQGHIEQVTALSTNASTGSQAELPKHELPPHILCRVVGVQLSAEPETDEVKAQISLLPEPMAAYMDAHSEVLREDDEPPPSSKRVIHMFCKTLTASDTSTHGGFSVPRKHAICLPPLDMSLNPPTQELVATDLHGTEWRFRHIYRGQPKRHLLTTGWSVFVSQKRLVAGNAVIFLRGENGELRVGIRRAMRQQSNPPPSVLPSQSMHMGVIATATHATQTRTMFSVYYTPRVSPAEFIIPLNKFKKASSLDLAVGMRFKMKFETEDLTERRYNGTITGKEDLDPIRWAGSKWRCLKVGWDDPTVYERQERLSPWEIELSVVDTADASSNTFSALRNKRLRPAVHYARPSAPEHSTLAHISHERSNAGMESMMCAAGLTMVLQGQEPRAISMREDLMERGSISHYQDLLHSRKPRSQQHFLNPRMQHHNVHQQDAGWASDSSKVSPDIVLNWAILPDQHQQRREERGSDGGPVERHGAGGHGASSGGGAYAFFTSSNSHQCNDATAFQRCMMPNLKTTLSTVPSSTNWQPISINHGGSSVAPNLTAPAPKEIIQSWRLKSPPHPAALAKTAAASGVAPPSTTHCSRTAREKSSPSQFSHMEPAAVVQQPSQHRSLQASTFAAPAAASCSWPTTHVHKESKKDDVDATAPFSLHKPAAQPVSSSAGRCKLFGFSLTGPPVPVVKGSSAPRPTASSAELESASNNIINNHNQEKQITMEEKVQIIVDIDGGEQLSATLANSENSAACSSEQQQQQQLGKKPASDAVAASASTILKPPKASQPQSAARCCTKVVKKGSIVGRGVDLSKFDGYGQLLEELERMFHMAEGGLRDARKGWQVAYADNEGDMLLVGDDPWQEFCSMVRKIHILSPEEVEGNKRLDHHRGSPHSHNPNPKDTAGSPKD